jgi:predicted anti-sigma-YlaC factor YlaD
MRNLIPAGWLTARLSLALLVFVSTSCSLKAKAVNTLADVLAESEDVYLSDEDPELVAEALPFNLKTIETLLASSPDHRGLLLSATTGFTFYAYGFVEPEADRIEDEDFELAEEIRDRAARLYWRAYRYGVRGLEVKHPGLGNTLSIEPESTVAPLEPEDVPLALWTAAALGGAIGVSKDDPEATADIAVVGALLERCLDLDPHYGEGILYELLVIYESQRFGGSPEQAREYYRRALELSRETRASTWLLWAENFSVPDQNLVEFKDLLDKVLAFDVDKYPKDRLLNILAQRRARWLMERVDELFLEGDDL